MSWSIGFDKKWNRDIGYGVPAYCDHPECSKEIDRGLSYVCANQEPRGGEGCGLYFCEEHKGFFKEAVTQDDEELEPLISDCCLRCREGKEPFTPKPEHPEWIAWKQTDPSWAEWRREQRKINKTAVKEAKQDATS